MVPVLSLWLPILLSAVFVFVVSSIIHMVLAYHQTDFKPVPNEEQVMAALRPFNIPPGDYIMPRAVHPKEMSAPGFQEKLRQGPVALFTVYPNGPFNMGSSLAQWFVYTVVVSLFAAYLTGRAVGPGTEYLDVFRFAGTAAFLGYALALWQSTIWLKRSWSTTLKSTFDGLVYALVTAGTFGWLWPA
jgi:hypothetical protein